VQDLTLVDQLAERPGCLLDWGARIDAVLVGQVDAVCSKSRKRALDGHADVLRRAVKAAEVLDVRRFDVLRARAAPVADLAELRREHHLVAAACQSPSDEFLVQVRSSFR
jgi:hypothetical protein